nr:uncharacterized protein LOC109178674 [Ipomoea batatas]
MASAVSTTYGVDSGSVTVDGVRRGGPACYLWLSILAAHDLLRHGIVRWIGNGVDTLVWDKPWLADNNNSQLFTSCVEEWREVWGSTNVLNGLSFVEFVSFELNHLNRDRATPMAALFWSLWRARNDQVWNAKPW